MQLKTLFPSRLCVFYLLQAAAVAQTDQSHTELFTGSVQLCFCLLGQSTGSLIQHCKKIKTEKLTSNQKVKDALTNTQQSLKTTHQHI